jgi:hypothetical protein
MINCSKADLNDGLVAYFPFDGNVEEVTGLSNDGINHGSTDTTDRFGVADHARHFTDGQYITVPRSAAIEPTNALTVTLWARLTKTSYYDQLALLDKRYNVGSPLYSSYVLAPNNNPNCFNVYAGIIAGGNYMTTDASVGMQPYVWTQEAMVYDGTNLKIYQNGQLVSEKLASGPLGYSSDDLYIGVHTPARMEQHWEGDIDDVRIYNRALSAGEIRELAVTPVPSAVLLGGIGLSVAGWRLRRNGA